MNLKYNFLILCFALSSVIHAKTKVWLDYDLSFGKLGREVDDGFALIHALKSQKSLEIIGLSSVFGNTNNMKHQRRWSYKILDKFDARDIPFFDGAEKPLGEIKHNDATQAMARALEKEKLTIMAMGRLTNVALLLKLRPDLSSQIEQVIVNAGRMLEYPIKFGKKGIIFPDTNVDGDPDAFQVLSENSVNLTMIPTESMTHLLWRKRELRQMRENGGISRWMAKKAGLWRFFWSLFPGAPGFIPWDVFVVSFITHPEDFYCHQNIPWAVKEMENDAHTLFRKRYRKERKDFLVASYSLNSSHRGTYCYHIKSSHREKLIDYWNHF